MNKKKIVEDYNLKIKLVEKYNEYYFNKSNPLVDDREYDQLKKNIILLEEKYKFLKKIIHLQILLASNLQKILKNHCIKFQCCHFQMHFRRMI